MGTIASQITSTTIVYSIVYSDADQRKHQSSASLALVRQIHRGPVNSPHKWPVTRKMIPFEDVIMRFHVVKSSCALWEVYYAVSIVNILGAIDILSRGSNILHCITTERLRYRIDELRHISTVHKWSIAYQSIIYNKNGKSLYIFMCDYQKQTNVCVRWIEKNTRPFTIYTSWCFLLNTCSHTALIKAKYWFAYSCFVARSAALQLNHTSSWQSLAATFSCFFIEVRVWIF